MSSKLVGNIAGLARVRDEDLEGEAAGRASGAGARALLESITSETRLPMKGPEREAVSPGPGRGRGRRVRARVRLLGLGVAVAGAAVVLSVVLPFGGPVTEYANAAVTLRTGDDSIDIVVTDPEAEADAFTEAFKAVGIDAEVRKIPVAPRFAGMLFGPATPGDFPKGTGVTVRTTGDCASVWCGTISMPTGYRGKLVVGIGRPAEPGERYAAIAPVGVPEPVPDGIEVRGRPVAEVRAELERRGMKAEYVVMWLEADGSGTGYGVDAQHVKDDWTVEGEVQIASDTVRLHVKAGPDVPPNSLPRSATPLSSPWWG